MLTRLTAGFSIFAVVVVALLIARGWVDDAEQMLGPGKKGERVVQAPVEAAQAVDAKADISILVREAEFAQVGGGNLDEKSLTKELQTSEPGMPLGEPLKDGGISLDVEGDVAIFCAQPGTDSFYCQASDLVTRQTGSGESGDLKQAMKLAEAAASQTAVGTEPDETGADGLGQEIAKRAKELQ